MHANLPLATRFHTPVTAVVTPGWRQTFTIAPQQEQAIGDTHALTGSGASRKTHRMTLKKAFMGIWLRRKMS